MEPEDYVRHWFSVYSLKERCSAHFLRQCAYAYRRFGTEPEMIASEIHNVESESKTQFKRPEQFRHAPLIGYWKLHFWGGGADLVGQMAHNLLREQDQHWFKKSIEKFVSEH